MKRKRAVFSVVILVFSGHVMASEYRDKGYLYLSPLPRAEYLSSQTRYFHLRFETISPHDPTNLSIFIDVTRAASGLHPSQTKFAGDERALIFEVSSDFSSDELVTVMSTPAVDICVSDVVDSNQYQFMVAGPMLFPPRPPISSGSPAHEEVMKSLFVWSLCLFPDVYNQFSKSV